MADFTIKSGSTTPALTVTLMDGVVPANLTGATVRMRMRDSRGGDLVIDALATISGDPTTGSVSYQWEPTDTDTVGSFIVEWEVTYANGTSQTFPTEGYTTVEVEESLETVEPRLPDAPDSCWPVDTSCVEGFGDHPASVQALAKALAAQSMRMLTGYSVGGCPVLLRPCARSCVGGSGHWYEHGSTFYPHIDTLGQWVNTCGCSTSCSCSPLAEVVLPSYAGKVLAVTIGTETLTPAQYRVDNGNRLVRLDGAVWPVCQDMSAAPGTEGAFVVEYLPGKTVDALGAQAAGLLAGEFAKACTGGKCQLPRSATAVTRQGVTMELNPGIFPDGVTNILQVDAYIRAYNPYKLAMPSAVYSPDMRQHRVTTWGP